MTIQLACLLAGAILPYIWAFASVPFRTKQLGTVDLAQPRSQAEQLVDAGARVVGAQMNAWEALTVFAVANLGAFMAGLDPDGAWATWCLIWVAGRVVHGAAYAAGLTMLRVAAFAAGIVASLAIMVLALTQ